MKQKDAVINEVVKVLAADGITFNVGVDRATSLLTPQQIAKVRASVTEAIINGTVVYSQDVSDANRVAKYVAGMVSHHLRKAKELNGGEAVKFTNGESVHVKTVAKAVSHKKLKKLKNVESLPQDLKDYILSDL